MAYVINQLCHLLAVWLCNKLIAFRLWKRDKAHFVVHSHHADLIICHVSHLFQIIMRT